MEKKSKIGIYTNFSYAMISFPRNQDFLRPGGRTEPPIPTPHPNWETNPVNGGMGTIETEAGALAPDHRTSGGPLVHSSPDLQPPELNRRPPLAPTTGPATSAGREPCGTTTAPPSSRHREPSWVAMDRRARERKERREALKQRYGRWNSNLSITYLPELIGKANVLAGIVP